MMPEPLIKDVWFRSPLSLLDIAQQLELRDIELDAENYWEWAIGWIDDVKLDITRTHTQPPETVDTKIFDYNLAPFTDDTLVTLVARLRPVVENTIFAGQSEYLGGDDFRYTVLRTYSTSTGDSSEV